MLEVHILKQGSLSLILQPLNRITKTTNLLLDRREKDLPLHVAMRIGGISSLGCEV